MVQQHHTLVVVGGGFAGTAAAISAARHGVDVLLIERYNCLGGAAANGLVMPFMGYYTWSVESGEMLYLCGDIFREIVREMNLLHGDGPDRYIWELDEEILKLVLGRMCLRYGVKLLFDTSVTGVRVEDGAIRAVETLSRGVSMTFTADYFIDATGDAELSAMAGCVCHVGRESDGLCQPMTLNFRMSSVDKAKFEENRAKINPLYKEFKEKGLIRNPREDVLIFSNFNDGVLHFNTTRVVRRDPTDPFDVTEAELEAREQVFEMLEFLKSNIEGFENARVLSTALQIGIRESRKVEGDYTLTVEDLKSLARFQDGIAVANYDIDIHSPTGGGTSHYYFGRGEWYEIPYRCLVPRGIGNLLVAGRCISSTHEAQASFRIMPFCSELGQAAGVAVAVAAETGTDTRGVDIDRVRAILRTEGYPI